MGGWVSNQDFEGDYVRTTLGVQFPHLQPSMDEKRRALTPKGRVQVAMDAAK